MAHTGKNWRLHFRRDVVLGCANHNVSLAYAYRMVGSLTWFTSPAATVIVLTGKDLEAANEFSDDLPEFRSEPFTLGGWTWELVLLNYTFLQPSQTSVFDWEAHIEGAKRVAFRMPIFTPGNANGFGTGPFALPIYTDTVFFPGGIGTTGLGASARRWHQEP